MIVDDLELADVAVLHHHGQEAGDNLRRGAKQDLGRKSFKFINNKKDFNKTNSTYLVKRKFGLVSLILFLGQ